MKYEAPKVIIISFDEEDCVLASMASPV